MVMMMGMIALAEIETITATARGTEGPGRIGPDYVTGVVGMDTLYEIVLKKTPVEVEIVTTIVAGTTTIVTTIVAGTTTIVTTIVVETPIVAVKIIAEMIAIAVVETTTIMVMEMTETITMVTRNPVTRVVKMTVAIVDVVVVAVEVLREEMIGNRLERISELRKNKQSLGRRHQLVTLPGE